MKKDAKIYVAGHAGLVGSALVRCLKAEGFHNLVTRTHAELDLSEQAAVRNFFAVEKPEHVFLAAARVGGIGANNRFRAQFIRDNLAIQSNVIHESYVSGVSKLLFLGSTCVYPKDAPQPMTEECLLTSPLEYTNEPYAVAKIAGLKMCESYNLQYGTNFISVMPTNLYGPHDNFDLDTSHALPALLRRFYLAGLMQDERFDEVLADLAVDSISAAETLLARHGVAKGTVEVWGTGSPCREFLYVDDMAEACVFLMNTVDFADLAEPGAREIRNTHINIGTGDEISIGALAWQIADITGYRGELRFNPAYPDGMARKLTDVRKIHRLGWKHRTGLDDGLRQTFAWYTSMRDRL